MYKLRELAIKTQELEKHPSVTAGLIVERNLKPCIQRVSDTVYHLYNRYHRYYHNRQAI